MRIIDADTVVTIQVFDEMYEEYNLKTMTIAEALDFWTEERCPSSVDAVVREEYYDALANKITDMEERGFVQVVMCKDCKYRRLYDYDDEPEYYYCALEDRPNRNWSVDDTDYCSWGEKGEVEE